MIALGVDAGSRAIKIAMVDGGGGRLVGSGTRDQGVDADGIAGALLRDVLADARLRQEDIGAAAATGYARNAMRSAARTFTEITCHARGVRHLAPEARTVVEMGGQDTKILHLAPDGSVADFAMNDRCAAGTGRFLEIVAARLGIRIEGLGELAAPASAPVAVSGMCAVFAENEITGLLAAGSPPEGIVAGVMAAVASRVAALAGPRLEDPVVFTGGVARFAGMRAALQKAMGRNVTVCPHAPLTGAIGAALLALEA